MIPFISVEDLFQETPDQEGNDHGANENKRDTYEADDNRL